MDSPLIAVVGNSSGCHDPALADRAAEELGTELAKRNTRLLVFSALPQFIEYHAVCGYLKHKGKREPRSVQVRYPPHLESFFPGEKPGDPVFVRTPQGSDWESSIYPAFADIDGLILIGGQYTTKIYGLLALGSQTPVIALGGLGGGAFQVLNSLRADPHRLASDDDLRLMAAGQWHVGSAPQLVASLLGQFERKAQREAERLLSGTQRQHRRTLNLLAIIACVFLAAVLVALGESLKPGIPAYLRILLFGVPAIAGASGAAIRVLWDNWQQHAIPLEIRPILTTVALGFWASGVAAAMFVIAQLWISSSLTDDQTLKLAASSVVIGLIAGLTLDRVFPKLIKSDIPIHGVPLTHAAGNRPGRG